MVLADVEFVGVGDLAVVLESLGAGGFLVGGAEGHGTDFEQLGGGEEGHAGGVVEKGVGEAAFVDEDDGKAGALGVDGAGEAGGAGTDDEDVVHG